MNRMRTLASLALVVAAALPQATSASAQTAAAADLEWLAGCWARTGEDSRLEEQWTSPAGGTLLGMSRTVRGGRTVAWEHLRIEERGDGLVYIASPSGQQTTEFAATHVSDTLAVFENPLHDFPQRILYRAAAGDSLWARIEGERQGAVRGVDFRMARAACPGAGATSGVRGLGPRRKGLP